MVSRLMLSLKKASRARENGWTSNALSRTVAGTITQIAFRDPPVGPEDSSSSTSDESLHSDLSDGQVGSSGERTVTPVQDRSG